jgi:protein-disulfide isomerase
MKRPAGIAVVLLALTSPVTLLGASCSGREAEGNGESTSGGNGSGTKNGHRPDPPERPTGERVESLDQVDVSELTSAERRVWVELINDQLSPCGDPVSVGRCVAEERRCNKCVTAARFLGRLVAEGYERNEIEELYANRYSRDRLERIDTTGHPVRGAPMSPITIIEFSDFECPYCGAAHPVLRRTLREWEGRVKMVFMHYPLDGHTHAMPAARAAVAAMRQGKFWEMHDLLFDNQETLEEEDIDRFAVQLGLDIERFHADIRSPETQRMIDQDKALGHQVGVEGTPTLFVNGRPFREPVQALSAYIREELD